MGSHVRNRARRPIAACSSLNVGTNIYSEPAARVSHLAPPPLAFSDLSFYYVRWSEPWIAASIRHFAAKWRLSESDEGFAIHHAYRLDRRARYFRGRRPLELLFGRERAQRIHRGLDALIDRTVVARELRRRRDRVAIGAGSGVGRTNLA